MKHSYSLMVLLAAIMLIPKCSNAQVNKNDSLALVDLYNSTNGNNWTNKGGWLQGPVSGWYGITVKNNRVVNIDIYDNNLTGTLPSSLGKLTALTGLYLPHNQIGGAIPASVCRIKSLRDLSIGDNNFTGHIPASLGSTGNLGFVVLYKNNLTGTIPATLGNSPGILQLDISYNQLTGAIPDSLKHCGFDELLLNNNQLSGSIPEWIGNSPNLENISLNNNKFTGTIPAALGNTHSYVIRLSDNQLNGSVPESLANLSPFEYIDLFNNHFNFDGLEYITSHASFNHFQYAPQYPIKLHSTNHTSPNVFSVSAGGTLSNNTYKWYKNNMLVATKVGDSTYITTDSGHYAVQVTNSIVTDLTLQSDTVFYNPTIQITTKDITVAEGGTSASASAAFSIKLNKAANVAVKVSYTTVNGTAVAGQDYVAQSGTLTFNPGQTFKKVNITVKGDATPESNERFYLQLSNAVNAVTTVKDSAVCTITNDDSGLMADIKNYNSSTAHLFPNPAKDVLYVNGLPAGVQSIAVVSASGSVLVQQTTSTNQLRLVVKKLAAGNYFLVIKTAGEQVSLPFVKL